MQNMLMGLRRFQRLWLVYDIACKYDYLTIFNPILTKPGMVDAIWVETRPI